MSDDGFPIARQILPLAEVDSTATAIPMTGIYIVAYANVDGEVSVKWHLEGEPDFHQILGVTEMFKMRVVATAYDWDGDDA